MDPLRLSVKAVIIEEGRLLVTENRDEHGLFYLLPGGGMAAGESILEALRRECREEIGAEVVPGDLLYVRDYIGKNHEFAAWDAHSHQVELMFSCALADGEIARTGTVPDSAQTGLMWLDLREIIGYRFYPQALKPILRARAAGGRGEAPIYLGDVN